eukprot:15459710-Alexandrium_andersonii.AAC.1
MPATVPSSSLAGAVASASSGRPGGLGAAAAVEGFDLDAAQAGAPSGEWGESTRDLDMDVFLAD